MAEGKEPGANLLFAGARISAKIRVLSKTPVILRLVPRWYIEALEPMHRGGLSAYGIDAPESNQTCQRRSDYILARR